MAKKSKALESGQSEESQRGGSTAEPKRCPEVSPTLREQCEQMEGHEGWHSTTGSAWKNFSLSCQAPRRIPMLTNMDMESVGELAVPVEGDGATAEPSIAEAPAGVVESSDQPQHRAQSGQSSRRCDFTQYREKPTEIAGRRVIVSGFKRCVLEDGHHGPHDCDWLSTEVIRESQASQEPNPSRQVETLLARIAELEARLARQAASHREVRKRLLRKARR